VINKSWFVACYRFEFIVIHGRTFFFRCPLNLGRVWRAMKFVRHSLIVVVCMASSVTDFSPVF